MVQGINSRSLRNNGAFIFTTKKTYIRVNKLNVTNDSNGSIHINKGSRFNVLGNLYNTIGDVILNDSSVSVIDSNIVNDGNLFLNDTSKIWVKKHIINTGFIKNRFLIEIGE